MIRAASKYALERERQRRSRGRNLTESEKSTLRRKIQQKNFGINLEKQKKREAYSAAAVKIMLQEIERIKTLSSNAVPLTTTTTTTTATTTTTTSGICDTSTTTASTTTAATTNSITAAKPVSIDSAHALITPNVIENSNLSQTAVKAMLAKREAVDMNYDENGIPKVLNLADVYGSRVNNGTDLAQFSNDSIVIKCEKSPLPLPSNEQNYSKYISPNSPTYSDEDTDNENDYYHRLLAAGSHKMIGPKK